jgi:hydroxyethylthiazole kinase-like uncharacterized protein yjeF
VKGRAPASRRRPLAPPELAEDAHKGDAGRVLSLCGSRAMPGAALLVARAAQRAGAGLVTAGCLDGSLMQLIPGSAPEAVLLDLERLDSLPATLAARGDHAVVVGPGIGRDERARELIRIVLGVGLVCPLVLDADALNVLEGEPERVRAHRGPLVITPHPGEAGRLLGRSVPRDAEGRVRAARELWERTGAVVCLKGRHTVVLQGDERFVNESGNAGMATAGAGDVLTGILGAYTALCAAGEHPGWTAFEAAASAVHVHGLAGDLAAERVGRRGMIASDLIEALPLAQMRREP